MSGWTQEVRKAVMHEIADYLPDYPDGGRTLEACADRVLAAVAENCKRLVEYTVFEGRTRRWECWRSDWVLISDEERFNLARATQALEDALQREMAHGLGDTIARKVVLEVLSAGRSEGSDV